MSGRASKQKGYRWEAEFREFARRWLPDITRNGGLYGQADRGDFSGVPGWVLQAKNHREFRLSQWLKEAEEQAENAGAEWFAVVVKRRGKGPEGGYFVMSIPKGLELIDQLQSRGGCRCGHHEAA